jgi:hypothetical protein
MVTRCARSAFLLLVAAVLLTAATPFLSTVTGTIANGASITGAIDVGDQPLIAIQMPAAWTTADLTFQASIDGTNFFDVYNLSGDEYTVAAAASRFIVLSPLEFQWARYIKIRSGPSASAVTQGGARTLTLVTRKIL